MDVRSDIFPDTPDGFHPRDVSVRLVRPDERIRWDRLMNQHHYLGFKRFPGRGLPYVFEWRGQWVGLAWQSGTFKCRPRDQWMALTMQRYQNGHRIFDTLLKPRRYHRFGGPQFSGIIFACFLGGSMPNPVTADAKRILACVA